MKTLSLVLFVLILAAAAAQVSSAPTKPLDKYMSEAKALADEGRLDDAIELLREAGKAYPNNSNIYANLGLYTGQSAGLAKDYTVAARLATQSFAQLDSAVTFGPDNPVAYLYRGIMAVNVPIFLGKLPGGIADLKKVIAIHDKKPSEVPPPMLVAAYSNLAKGYQAGNDPVNARAAYETVIKLAPGTEAAKTAEANLATLAAPSATPAKPKALEPKAGEAKDIAALKTRVAAEPSNTALLLDLARALLEANRYEEARDVLHEYNKINPSNAQAWWLLVQAVSGMVQPGYDSRIANDTNFRTNLAFEAMSASEKAVELAPDSLSYRLYRGVIGVSMPFFVGKFDQGAEDLQYVLKHTTSPLDSAQAMYFLGVVREREAMRYWTDVAKRFPNTDQAKLSMEAMRPSIPHFDPAKASKPVVAIDFVLGYRDELAPQTAIWIEDASGKYVKTVFVSGFAGNVKGKQVTLPVWAEISKFEGADAVTSASIDVGHYIYTWDCKDLSGKPVAPGKYTAKVEVSHWPSMKYQQAETSFDVGPKESASRVEEGNYIPSLIVTYYPK